LSDQTLVLKLSFARYARWLLAGLAVTAMLLSRPAFADSETEDPASKALSEEALVAASSITCSAKLWV